MKEKIVIVLSGGMDSGVLLAKTRKDNPHSQIHALTFNYGSNHADREIAKARWLATKYANNHVVIPLVFIAEYFVSTLLSGGSTIPDGGYREETMKSTVVPFRNGIMLAIATGYAESIGSKTVLIGAHAGDHYIYPDCRPAFIKAFADSARLGTANEIEVLAPFSGMTKRDIGIMGRGLEFDFVNTYTCYKGGKQHCGVCGSCTERKEALAGFDATKYEA